MNKTTQPTDFLSGFRLTEELPQMPEHLSEHITKLFTLMYRIVSLGQEAQQYMVTLGTLYGNECFDNEAESLGDDMADANAKIWGVIYEMIRAEADEELQNRSEK